MPKAVERILIEQPVAKEKMPRLRPVAVSYRRAVDEIVVGEECAMRNTPAIRGIYRGMAQWVGAGVAEIQATTNSAYAGRGTSFLVPYGSLRRCEV